MQNILNKWDFPDVEFLCVSTGGQTRPEHPEDLDFVAHKVMWPLLRLVCRRRWVLVYLLGVGDGGHLLVLVLQQSV